MNVTFPYPAFDLVVANHMLYHVPSVAQVLGQVSGLLNPGGRFMAATNGPEHMVDLDILLEKFSRKLDKGPGCRWIQPVERRKTTPGVLFDD